MPRVDAGGSVARFTAGGRLAAVVVLALTVPFGLRILESRQPAADAVPSYLPSLEQPRPRAPFDPFYVVDLARIRPRFVIVGDSMAGSRIDQRRLSELTGTRVYEILQAASGPAFWYLALKNWIIPSGARPQYVFIFFRDTNLTDVTFRLDEAARAHLDTAAHDVEEELDAVVRRRGGAWRERVERAVDTGTGAASVRAWMVPALADRAGRFVEPRARQRGTFNEQMNERLAFTHMRPVAAADIAATPDAEADFDRDVDRSVLPLMLRDAERAGIRLFFVRVQRRPEGGRPPKQSEALRRYVARLRDYIVAHGGLFRDDTGDPALAIDMYGDGDHLAREARERYTDIFWSRIQPLLQ